MRGVFRETFVLADTFSGRRRTDTSGSVLDSHELHATGRTALDGHRGLATAKLLGHQRNEFLICLPLHRRRLELSRPQPRTFFHEDARARAWLDPDLNYLHRRPTV